MDADTPLVKSEALPAARESFWSAGAAGRRFNAFSLLLFAAGLLLIAWAASSGDFRDGENALSGKFCLPFSFGVGVIVLGVTFATRWRKAGFWFASALCGQAASLQLINAGAALRYQHYKPLGEIFSDSSPAAWGFLIFQSVVVFLGIFRRRVEIIAWLKANFRLWQISVAAAFFFIPTATVSEDVSFYVREWFLAGFIQTVNLCNIVLFALAVPVNATGNLHAFSKKLFGNSKSESEIKPAAPDRFVLILAVWVMVTASLLCVYSYERHPHVPDEVVYIIHARFLAAGALTMPAPPVPEAFEAYLMKADGERWYPVTPPGWAVMLAVGVLLGASWLVNPFLAGLNLLLAYMLLREIYARETARLAVLLLAFSPWYVFLGMSFMTHMFALTCALAASLFVARAQRTGKIFPAFAGGLFLGALSLIRPLEAVAAAILLGLWALGVGGKRLKLSGVSALAFGTLITGGAGLFYNAVLTGDPLRFPVNAYLDEYFGKNSNAYGFGPDRGMGWAIDPNPGHGPLDALINSNLNATVLNADLFGWSIGAFLFIALRLCLGKHSRGDRLMAAVVLVIYVLHFFYYFSGGPDFAARYWFLMIVPLAALTAGGIQTLAARAEESSTASGVRLAAAVVSLCLLTAINFIPWRALDKYRNFRGMRPDIRSLADRYDFGKSLVLIQGNMHPDYDSALIYNHTDFNADAPVYAWDRDAETRRKLLVFYKDRPVWIVKSPSLTNRGFEVADGPLPADELLRENER